MRSNTDASTAPGDLSDRLPLAPTAFTSQTREGRHAASAVCGSECGVSSSLERALVTIGRDSALRHKFLRKRWQGAIERLRSSDKLHPTAQELWWSRRLRTPLGRALSRLN